MDPITMIVSTLAAGAVAGLKPTAEQLVKDAYAAVKGLLVRKYPKVDVSQIERKPESEAKRASVGEDLADAGASDDQELLARIKTLLDAIDKHAPEAGAAIGVDISEVKAASLKIKKVTATGTGVRVEKSEFTGDIDLGEVSAGGSGNNENPQ